MNRVMMVLMCLGIFCLSATGLSFAEDTATQVTDDAGDAVEVTKSESGETQIAFQDFVIVLDVEVDGGADAEANEEEACEAEDCEEGPCDSEESAVAEGEKKKKSGGLFGVIRAVTGTKRVQVEQPVVTEDSVAEEDGDFTATHRQVALLKVKKTGEEASDTEEDAQPAAASYGRGGWGVKSFCLDNDDNLVVAVGDKSGELQILNPQGEVLHTVSLPVVPEAVNVAADGNYLVAGGGKVLKLNSAGTVLLEAESPVIKYIQENKEQMREEVAKQLKSRTQTYTRMLTTYQQRIDQRMDAIAAKLPGQLGAEFKQLRKLVAEHKQNPPEEMDETDSRAWELRTELLGILEQKVKDQASEADQRYLDLFMQQVNSFQSMVDQMDEDYPSEQDIDQALEAQISSKSSFSSLSAVGSDVFIATRATEGYGYDVWRMDENLADAERIVKDLRGCCGQMDVQACASGLYVAENSRHQVNHFNREGGKVNSWGSRGRDGVRGYTGCCNPMNVAFGPDGSVYTSESGTGRIKRYTPEGELMELIGSVELVPGCKKVSIGVTKDHKRVYMLDITRNHIIVMEEKPIETQAATAEAEENQS